MIDLCTIPDTSVRHALKEYRLIQGLHSALSPKGSSTFLAYRCIGYPQPLRRYTVNARSRHPLGKIRLRCRIGNLKSEVTCYVIDADTSYNLLLGWSWIHANWIVPFTLHQCFKYVEDDTTVQTVFAEKQPSKGVENYFTDALLYLSLIHIWRCRRSTLCRSRWSPYH